MQHELLGYEERAEYGKKVLKSLSNKLTNAFGEGFSRVNLIRMKNFYECFPISSTVSHQLSWSHYVELFKISNKEERKFYTKESINSNWRVRELQRQKNSKLYNRLLLSTNKEQHLNLINRFTSNNKLNDNSESK